MSLDGDKDWFGWCWIVHI